MRLAGIAAGLTFALDQFSKYVVVRVMGLDQVQAIDVLPPWLNFRMAWNQGVNFGLFSGEAEITRWVLIAVAVVISAWVWIWVRRDHPASLAQLSAGLLVGGALANVADRLIYGAVADFINMSLPGWANPYSYNIADIGIFAGALGLVFFTGPKDKPTA